MTDDAIRQLIDLGWSRELVQLGLEPGAVSRGELISAVRAYVAKKRNAYEAHFRDVRAVIAAGAGNRPQA